MTHQSVEFNHLLGPVSLVKRFYWFLYWLSLTHGAGHDELRGEEFDGLEDELEVDRLLLTLSETTVNRH